jgi:uncharacterized membrane protein
MSVARTAIIAIGLLAACIWVGSLVCLALVVRVARSTLDGQSSVTFFRSIGRLYAWVGTGSLLVAIVVGLVLGGSPQDWDGAQVLTAALAALLVLLTVVAMGQARAMTVKRRAALADPGDAAALEAVRRGASVAGALRGSMAVVTLVLVVVGAGMAA